MEVFLINGVLAAILIYLLMKRIRRDSENRPGNDRHDDGL